MLKINITIIQCIFLLAVPNVNGFKILKFNNLDQIQMVSNVLQMIKKINSRSEARHSNNVEVVGYDELKKIIQTRKNQNAKGFINNRLVKRVVPHGYEVSYMEYDNKFHTLYKPLVRIHKTPSNNKNVENKYDLVFVLHDDQYKDVVSDLAKDESLLEPFAMDSNDIEELTNDRYRTNLDYYIDNDNKSKSVDRSKSHRNKVDLTRQMKDKDIQNELQHDIKDKSFDILLENHMKSVNKDDILEYKLLDLIAQLVNKNCKPKRSKLTADMQVKQNLWFNTIVDLISKQLKRDQKHGSLEKSHIQQFEYSKQKNADDTYLPLLEKLVQNRADTEKREEIEELESKNGKWFFPVGSLKSMQSMRFNEVDGSKPKHDKVWNYPIRQSNLNDKTNGEIYDTRDEVPPNTNDLKYMTIRKEKDDLIESLKKMITSQFPKLVRNEQRLFGKLGELNGQKFKRKESHSHPIKKYKNTRWSKDFKIWNVNKKPVQPDLSSKSDKYSLLSQIAKLKMNNREKEENKKLKKRDGFMRFGYKSGEDEMKHIKKKDDDEYFWTEDATTTKKPSWKSNYPYWNYWTYEKNIIKGTCKGNSVQIGQVCVSRN